MHMQTDEKQLGGEKIKWQKEKKTERQLVSWCFKPSQPQRITSGLKTNFSITPS